MNEERLKEIENTPFVAPITRVQELTAEVRRCWEEIEHLKAEIERLKVGKI